MPKMSEWKFLTKKLQKISSYNVTPLVTAAAIGFRAGCEELVDHGADMNYIVERTGFLD